MAEPLDPADVVGTPDSVRASYDRAPVALATVAGPEHRFVACNDAYRSLCRRTDLLGRRAQDAWPELEDLVVDVLDRARESGVGESFRAWQLGVDRAPAGTDAYFDLVIAPFRGADGAVAGLYLVVTDVTDRVLAARRSEEQVRDARHRHVTAVGAMAALQDELLPRGLPVLPDLDVAASYLLADEARAGGDWFDCIVRPDGSVALVVGDVVGHGVVASAVMGQLRAVLHERLLGGDPLPAAVAALDRFAGSRAESAAATVCVAVLDRATGALDYVTAGHPVPLVVDADGSASYLPRSGGGPLGTGSAPAVRTEHVAEGATLLLYTDGILERPGRTPAQSSVELLGAVREEVVRDTGGSSSRAAARSTCDALELLSRETGHRDDITLLAAQRTSVAASRRLERPATSDHLREIRGAIVRWLGELEVSRLEVNAVEHAVGELVANVVEHAYEDQAGMVRVHLDVGPDGLLRGVVSDVGRWRHGSATDGRGLAMVRALMDTTRVERSDRGTTVTVFCPLTRPALLLRSRGLPHPPPPLVPGDLEVEAEDDVVTVSGAVDLVSGDRFRALLYRELPGPGEAPRMVDLDRVTHLGSVGVQVLYELTGQGGLRLRASAGSVAQQVLDLVRLDHE